MKTPIENGLTADNSQPENLLSKSSLHFTTKSISIATIFVAANAALTGYAAGFAYENYGVWAAIPPVAFWLTTVVFWGAA